MKKNPIIADVIFVYKTAPSFGINGKKDKIFFQASLEMYKKKMFNLSKKNLNNK